jgi:photosystem II stability/assembly factor-like uncharacterized protein
MLLLDDLHKKDNSDSDFPAERDFRFEASPRERFDDLLGDITFGNEQVLKDPLNSVLGTAYLKALEHKQQMIRAVESRGATAAAGLSNWIQLGPTEIPNGQTYDQVNNTRVLVSGRVTCIATHTKNPQVIYVGAARGGIWKSTDGGITWYPKSDNEASLAIGALALAPSNPDIIYVGTGEGNLQLYTQVYPRNSSPDSFIGAGVLKSVDGGDTWTRQGDSIFKGAAFYTLAAHPANDQIAFAATSNGLFRTTDGGSTWVQMANGLPTISSSIIAACDVAIDPSKPNTVYVAFWGDGIYRSNDANSTAPRWTKLGLPDNDISRIVLAISPSSPEKLFAFVSDGSDGVKGVYYTPSRGDSWNSISLSGATIGVAGAYDLDIAVDPSTPDIIFLAGVSLYKGIRNPSTDSWSFSDIGVRIHPDNHALAFDPINHLTVYAGNDGGIYKSQDGGITWKDNINKGLCILQYEFIDQHPSSSGIVIGGTQDNGTQLFKNSSTFYHSDDGDGGCAAIDQNNPNNMLHTYYTTSLRRSVDGGSSWTDVDFGLAGRALFYAPFSLDKTNQNNIAYGTDRICLDSSQGSGGWPTKVSLPGIVGSVSTITYVNSKLIYAGTSSGQVYQITNSGGTWSAISIHAPPLPSRWIWDIATLPGQDNTLILAMSGIGTPHIWEGKVSSSPVLWKDISGSATNRLPDIPAYAIATDSQSDYYVGTEIGVFKTTDSGSTWEPFGRGLPNCAVYDLRLHIPTRLLRAGTHGRGLWECKLD